MAKVNGTHAKEVAIHFLDMTQERYTPAIVSKTIVQAKSLLGAGYTVEEIKRVIEYIVKETGVAMYSLGYVNAAINGILEKLAEIDKEEEIQALIKKSKAEVHVNTNMKEGAQVNDEGSRERNKQKLDGISLQSRKREKSYLDMLEE